MSLGQQEGLSRAAPPAATLHCSCIQPQSTTSMWFLHSVLNLIVKLFCPAGIAGSKTTGEFKKKTQKVVFSHELVPDHSPVTWRQRDRRPARRHRDEWLHGGVTAAAAPQIPCSLHSGGPQDGSWAPTPSSNTYSSIAGYFCVPDGAGSQFTHFPTRGSLVQICNLGKMHTRDAAPGSPFLHRAKRPPPASRAWAALDTRLEDTKTRRQAKQHLTQQFSLQRQLRETPGQNKHNRLPPCSTTPTPLAALGTPRSMQCAES